MWCLFGATERAALRERAEEGGEGRLEERDKAMLAGKKQREEEMNRENPNYRLQRPALRAAAEPDVRWRKLKEKVRERLAAMRSAIVVVSLLFVPTLVLAQPGHIGVFADPAATDCYIDDEAESPVDVYVVHWLTPGATGSRFRVVETPGITMTYLGETPSFDGYYGNSRTAVTVCYGGCFVGPILLATLHYLGHGTSALCSFIDVAAPIGSEFIEVIDCDPSPNAWSAGHVWLHVNGKVLCTCEHDDYSYCPVPLGPKDICTTPVAPSTWGSIKSFYGL